MGEAELVCVRGDEILFEDLNELNHQIYERRGRQCHTQLQQLEKIKKELTKRGYKIETLAVPIDPIYMEEEDDD